MKFTILFLVESSTYIHLFFNFQHYNYRIRLNCLINGNNKMAYPDIIGSFNDSTQSKRS